MSDQNIGTDEGTGSSADNSNQAQAGKTYTQEEFDNHMARMRASLEKRLLKPYQDLGDPDELRQLKANAEKLKTEQAMSRGEFEKILQESLAKKDAEIQRRDSIIQEYKIDVPLMQAASKFRAVNAEQVKALLKNSVRLNADGEVEVIDAKGTVMYDDKGLPVTVDDYVKGFLDSNPHFQTATVSTTNSKSNIAVQPNGRVDFSGLDMRNPENRKKYAEAKAKGLV